MKAAIIGLPNVGKSTLFNALAAAEVPTENRPFCTIDPNVARVPIPDPRLDAVAQAAGMQQKVHATLELVDVAGLVKGASRGEGLGNRFLAQVREADAAVHVLRCFESGRVTHVSGAVDPVDDAEIVNTELMLADLATVERALDSARRRAKSGHPDLKKRVEELESLHEHLAEGTWEGGRPVLPLLTAMPTLYALNVAEEHLATGGPADLAEQFAAKHGKPAVRVTAQLESELAAMPREEQQDLRKGLGLPHETLQRFMQALSTLLNLNTFFTAGPSEARAWLIPDGATAHYAAGRVHTDFQQRFVRAEVTHWQAFASTPQPRPDLKGRDYEVRDGDVLRFRAG
ncbi:MAG: redox-regulated ATPase YchF [Gammaproteobacteria bacterium]|nr:redox-regulated ATPase YchF [Gammaproteobacteria bacterium]MYF66034.1 redox-regulated ATPase YchF [Gammaproteobacteria bacterium]MYK38371.1 redox-regulated ATPase YchF [Gammaproteobacteria bacterium]